MKRELRDKFNQLGSSDDKIRMDALQSILKLTDQKVDWIYEVWDELFEKLKSGNSFQRSIGILVICNLAKSDSQDRLRDRLDLLLAHTHDEKFITSRQCIQNIWKIAALGGKARKKVLDHLEKRFRECENEKHYNLLRADILRSMLFLYALDKDEALLALAQNLIAEEKEARYQKKYESIFAG